MKKMHPLPKNQEPARNAEDWANRWAVPDIDELIKGNETFPNMKHRQDRLVGNVLDACVVLHVYERLKRKDSFESLKYFFPGKHTKNEIETLEHGTNEERLALLVKISQEKGPVKRLRTHRTLVDQQAWNHYLDEFANYEHRYKEYSAEVHQAVEEHRDLRSLGEAPKAPEDPRVLAINKHVRSTIQLLNPGPKHPGRIQEKSEEKQVRDINRVGVLPVLPEYARDFVKVMEMFNPPKEIVGHGDQEPVMQIPRIFSEPPEVFLTGYFNQKLFVALDRPKARDSRTTGNAATIGEIKIVPAAMEHAEHLTDKLKPMIKAFFKPAQYTAQAEDYTKPLALKRQAKLKADFLKQKRAFEEQLDKFKSADPSYKFNYKFPDFPPDSKLMSHETYIHKGYEFLDLSLKIHEDAIRSENQEWQREFVNTAQLQKICGDDKFFKRDFEKLERTDVPRVDALVSGVLKRIAEGNNWDLRAMESEQRQRRADAHWQELRNKKSRTERG